MAQIRYLLLSAFIGIALVIGCGGGSSSSSSTPPSSAPSATVSGVTVTTTPADTTQLPLQETVGLAAAVTGSGSFSTNVTWSVNGIANGNASVGSISQTSSGPVYTAPSALPSNPSLKITATSVTDTSKSASVTLSIQSPDLAALPVSTASPLTPIQLPTTGLNPALPVQVTYADTSGSSGMNVTLPAISVGSDGTVVAAVPLFVTQATQTISSGTVSVTLEQSGITSHAETLTIQDLPSVSSYGVNPGDIARAVLNFNAMQLSHRLNALQALQGSVGNTVDATATIQSLKAQLATTIAARSDVDRIATDPTTVIPAETLSDGTQVNFDASGLDMMERVQAVFLSQTFGKLVLGVSPNQKVPAVRLDSSHVKRRTMGLKQYSLTLDAHAHHARHKSKLNPQSSSLTTFQQILYGMQGLAISSQIPLTTIELVNSKGLSDSITAISGGVSSLAAFAKSTAQNLQGSDTFISNAKSIGTIAGLISTVQTVTHCWEDDGMWVYAKLTGDDATASVIAQDMSEIKTSDLYDALKNLATSPVILEESAAAELGSTVLDFIGQGIKYYDLANPKPGGEPAAADDAVSTSEPASDDPVFAAPNPGLVQVEGQADVPSSLGANTPLSGIDLSPAPGGDDNSTLSDTSGDFSMFVPLGDSNFDYASTDFSVIDPLSQVMLGSETVDLSGSKSGSVQIPPIAAAPCTDDDAGTPDGDDPDCD